MIGNQDAQRPSWTREFVIQILVFGAANGKKLFTDLSACRPRPRLQAAELSSLREAESLCHQVWSRFVPSPPAAAVTRPGLEITESDLELELSTLTEGTRAHWEYRNAVSSLLQSDEAFDLFPKEARIDLLQLRHLLRGLPEVIECW